MGIVVRIEKQKALLREGVWRCADLALEQRLNDLTAAWIVETGKPAIGAQDPEREVASEMIRRLDGVILYHSPTKGREASRHFFKKRQLSLF
ncbi:MAG: hypothetical protein IPP47_03470 [Bryobacterales bacterium]|nr:hypothetical protein [Bryobacterales bacterium]